MIPAALQRAGRTGYVESAPEIAQQCEEVVSASSVVWWYSPAAPPERTPGYVGPEHLDAGCRTDWRDRFYARIAEQKPKV
ncbi:hypothetical protein KCP70_00785 [Salmonella enterica subsp. enterica]|nr:hypothetical protein KCP70_00785 [Salmonella enterica subsp. enterica]